MNSLASALRAGLHGLPEEVAKKTAALVEEAASEPDLHDGRPQGAAPTEPPAERAVGAGPRSCPVPLASPPGLPKLGILLQPRPLILTGLPYKPTPLREVSRTARLGTTARMTVTYIATDARFGLPFGADRALLAWVTTKAFQDGTVRFSSVAEYFEAFGLHRSGADYRRFRERWQRVSSLALRIEETDEIERRVRRLFLVPTSREALDLLEGTSGRLKPELASERYGFALDREFWQYLRDTRIPTPLALLRRFHDQPQAWDFTQFVLFRCYSARQPSLIPWLELLEQLGLAPSHPRRLRQALAGVLATVRGQYPDFPAHFLPGSAGLEVQPWRMPMSE